jgi:hypothetical protein
MSPETEIWIVAITVAAAVVPWAFSLHAKVAVIAHSCEQLPEMFAELRDKLAEHEARLDEHESQLAAIKATPPAGG